MLYQPQVSSSIQTSAPVDRSREVAPSGLGFLAQLTANVAETTQAIGERAGKTSKYDKYLASDASKVVFQEYMNTEDKSPENSNKLVQAMAAKFGHGLSVEIGQHIRSLSPFGMPEAKVSSSQLLATSNRDAFITAYSNGDIYAAQAMAEATEKGLQGDEAISYAQNSRVKLVNEVAYRDEQIRRENQQFSQNQARLAARGVNAQTQAYDRFTEAELADIERAKIEGTELPAVTQAKLDANNANKNLNRSIEDNGRSLMFDHDQRILLELSGKDENGVSLKDRFLKGDIQSDQVNTVLLNLKNNVMSAFSDDLLAKGIDLTSPKGVGELKRMSDLIDTRHALIREAPKREVDRMAYQVKVAENLADRKLAEKFPEYVSILGEQATRKLYQEQMTQGLAANMVIDFGAASELVSANLHDARSRRQTLDSIRKNSTSDDPDEDILRTGVQLMGSVESFDTKEDIETFLTGALAIKDVTSNDPARARVASLNKMLNPKVLESFMASKATQQEKQAMTEMLRETVQFAVTSSIRDVSRTSKESGSSSYKRTLKDSVKFTPGRGFTHTTTFDPAEMFNGVAEQGELALLTKGFKNWFSETLSGNNTLKGSLGGPVIAGLDEVFDTGGENLPPFEEITGKDFEAISGRGDLTHFNFGPGNSTGQKVPVTAPSNTGWRAPYTGSARLLIFTENSFRMEEVGPEGYEKWKNRDGVRVFAVHEPRLWGGFEMESAQRNQEQNLIQDLNQLVGTLAGVNGGDAMVNDAAAQAFVRAGTQLNLAPGVPSLGSMPVLEDGTVQELPSISGVPEAGADIVGAAGADSVSGGQASDILSPDIPAQASVATPQAQPSQLKITPGSRAQVVSTSLQRYGDELPPHVIDGILMNIQSESNFNPGINEANPTVKGSRGGFGLVQLTGPRRVAYEKWVSSLGKPLNDVDAQVDFILRELRTTESAAYRSLMKTTNSSEAAIVFLKEFERPSAENVASRTAKYGGAVGVLSGGVGGMTASAAVTGAPVEEGAEGGAESEAEYASQMAAVWDTVNEQTRDTLREAVDSGVPLQDIPEYKEALTALTGGTGGGDTATSSVAKEVSARAIKALQDLGLNHEEVPSFNTPEEIDEAISNGSIEEGQTILLGGRVSQA